MRSTTAQPSGRLSRRHFLGTTAGMLATGCGRQNSRTVPAGRVQRMIVLGVDGMDPRLTRKYLQAGLLPNCQRLISRGGFRQLRTSDPPQSPVAWSNFISGTNPGGHGIFDFIARDPATMLPYQSTSRTDSSADPLQLGNWQIPLAESRLTNQRKGPTFWNNLTEAGVPATVFRVPANFPPTATEATTVAGMGTPDLQGGYGIFTYFTDDIRQWTRDVSGGRIELVSVVDHIVRGEIRGPVSSFSAAQDHTKVPLTVYLDSENPVARIQIQDTAVLLQEGEWSEWIRVRFPLIPHAVEVSGICRMLLKQVRGGFGLYVSPVNIDPADPSLPLTTPPDYSARLTRELGYFYTQGMIEDTHALSAGVLDEGEYRQQATFVIDERMRFFEHELSRFDDGFLFFYFSSLDLSSHVFWRTLDPGHPMYSPKLAREHADFIPELYARIDQAVGRVLDLADENTIVMVMSDHGFTSFRRQFNLNSWLMDHGYTQEQHGAARGMSRYFQDVNWKGTRAYGLGLNGLYLNLEGRERDGRVGRGDEATGLEQELIDRLQNVRDPETGEKVIANVFRAREIYQGPYAASGPDLIVGYRNHYRASWDTVLGGFPREHVLDNQDAWSGDHCIDSQFVPGVLMCSRPIRAVSPCLQDIAPTVLTQFGVPVPGEMTGANVL